MKKRVIALSVAAALGAVAGTASAQTTGDADTLVFNADGVGHILLVPYFSTQGGNATLLNIVNTDRVRGKAVKVRFRGASNSDDIFDFQLFMSPADVWTANISQGPNGQPRLATSDKSCTLPANVNQDFILTRLNGADLSGDALANEAREGYVEILNMGDIPSVSGTTSVWFATKHNSAGVAPCTASILESLTQSDTRLLIPTTGLMANWTIINVPNTTVYTGEAAAIEARTLAGVASTGNNVFWPQTAVPLTPAQVAGNTADPLFIAGVVEGASYDLPDLSTPYVVGFGAPQLQANFLSNSIAAITGAAEYLSSSTISATTDWVITKPTRRYYVAVDYSASSATGRLVTNFDDNTDPNAWYYRSKLSDGNTATGNTVMGNSVNGGKSWQACTQVDSVAFWNREEGSPVASGIVISPGQPAPAPSLCGEVSVLGINSPTSSVNAKVSRFNITLPASFIDGWGVLNVNNTYSGVNLGLPMLLNQFSKATNPAVSPGVSGTFGAKWTGRILRRGDNLVVP